MEIPAYMKSNQVGIKLLQPSGKFRFLSLEFAFDFFMVRKVVIADVRLHSGSSCGLGSMD